MRSAQMLPATRGALVFLSVYALLAAGPCAGRLAESELAGVAEGAGAGAGAGVGGAHDACRSATTCAQCSALFSGGLRCGWCVETATCQTGTAAGSSSGAACSGRGNWNYGQPCAELCALRKSCGDCTALADKGLDCGWCLNGQGCQAGTPTAASQDRCKGSEWVFGAGLCAADPCARYVNLTADAAPCDTCTQESGCGWCAATGSRGCQAGNLTSNKAGTCQGDADWIFADGCSRLCGFESVHGCSNCVEEPDTTCGWCKEREVCKQGEILSSTDHACEGNEWYFGRSPSTCNEDPCQRLGTCAGCQLADGCGWCQSLGEAGQCVTSNPDGSGPASSVCDADAWVDGGQCSSLCDRHQQCDACLGDSEYNCGWCKAQGVCKAGSQQGSFYNSGSTVCDGSNWLFGAGNCDKDACSIKQNPGQCGSCTQNPGCGYCETPAGNGTCLVGNAVGPVDKSAQCARWGSTQAGGCQDVFCEQFTTCSDCAANSCGWCMTDSRCYSQDDNTNDDHTHDAVCAATAFFNQGYCPSTNCSALANCGDCTSSNNCGWCLSSGTCSIGMAAGPSTANCSSTDWLFTARYDTGAHKKCCQSAFSCSECVGPTSGGWCRWCEHAHLDSDDDDTVDDDDGSSYPPGCTLTAGSSNNCFGDKFTSGQLSQCAAKSNLKNILIGGGCGLFALLFCIICYTRARRKRRQAIVQPPRYTALSSPATSRSAGAARGTTGFFTSATPAATVVAAAPYPAALALGSTSQPSAPQVPYATEMPPADNGKY